MDNIFENFTFTILKLNKLVQKIKHHEMEELGLKTIHAMCLYHLYTNPQGLTPGELVKLTLEDKAAISRAMKTLKERGYARYDGGAYNSSIVLTESGTALAETVLTRANIAVDAGSCDFSDEERTAFYKLLGAIADRLQDYYNSLKGDKND